MSRFTLTSATGTPAVLLSSLPDSPTGSGSIVRLCEVTESALVLGSSQPESDVDHRRAEAAGVEVVRRRAGGGAVLVEPGAQLWVDVWIPTADRLFSTDVGVAFHWLGDVFAQALRRVAGEQASVHKGALVSTEWSRLLCFCGVGPGEAILEGRKVVGLAQRRNRFGAWLHALVPYELDAARIASLLALTEEERVAAGQALVESATATSADPAALAACLLEELAVL